MDRFFAYVKSLFETNSFKEVPDSKDVVKNVPKKETFWKKIFNLSNFSTFAVGVSFYFLGKKVMKTQFINGLLNCNFITPSIKGHSDICCIESLDDITDNDVQLHKKGEVMIF